MRKGKTCDTHLSHKTKKKREKNEMDKMPKVLSEQYFARRCMDGWLVGFNSTANEFNCAPSSVSRYLCAVPMLP